MNWYPKVITEMRRWSDAGLIPPFSQADMQDDVFVKMLGAMRRFLEREKAEEDRVRAMLERMKQEVLGVPR